MRCQVMNIFRFSENEINEKMLASAKKLLRESFSENFLGEKNNSDVENPSIRVLLCNQSNEVVAHLSAYERDVEIEGKTTRIGMLGNVAVSRTQRKKGFARQIIQEAHEFFRSRSIAFSILFACRPEIYHSSGYELMANEICFLDEDKTWRTFVYRGSMFCELGEESWPNRKVNLRGPVV